MPLPRAGQKDCANFIFDAKLLTRETLGAGPTAFIAALQRPDGASGLTQYCCFF
jgi:hypothetical protein